MSQIIKFNVQGDTLTPLKYSSFNSGSKGYYTAEFTFDEDWKGLIPHITISENGKKRADEVIIDGTHKIAVTESGTMEIGVYGLDAEGNKCISCNHVVLSVQKGSYNEAPSLPSDIWNGYQITVMGYTERAEKAAEKAEKAVKEVKNLSVSAVSGSEAAVIRTETEDHVELQFVLPKGEKPEKGIDYWTEEDKAETKEYIDGKTAIMKADIKGIQEDIKNEAHFRGYIFTNPDTQFIEATPNDFIYSSESGTVWVYDVDYGWQDTGEPVPDQLTPASEKTPLMDGEASVGSEQAYARGDHRHPTDTTRASVEELNGLKTDMKNLGKQIPVVDTEFSFGSYNPIANAPVALKFENCENRIGQNYNSIYSLNYRVGNVEKSVAEVKTSVGNIETALDSIIAIQETLIGGESV